MKHRNLVETFVNATTEEKPDLTISGAEAVRLTESQKSLERLKTYKTKREIQQRESLERLKQSLPVADSLNPPRQFQPHKFLPHLEKSKLYFGEFQAKFSNSPYKLTREEYKRYWLICAGASMEEIANLTGYTIAAVSKACKKLIEFKVRDYPQAAEWIQQKATMPLAFSGNASTKQLGLEVNTQQDLRLKELQEQRLTKLRNKQ